MSTSIEKEFISTLRVDLAWKGETLVIIWIYPNEMENGILAVPFSLCNKRTTL